MRNKGLAVRLLGVLLLLALLPTFPLSISAAEEEGDWTIYRRADSYHVEEDEVFCPAPGYTYTSEGFTTIAPDWTNFTPYFTVQTKEAQPLKQGFYMEVRIDEFPYGGENGADHWISFSLSDREKIAPGSLEYGNNWLSLLRGEGDGFTFAQSFLTTMATEEERGMFRHYGDVSIRVPMDEAGREIYTFEVVWNGSAYDIKICGVSVQGMVEINTKLKQWNPSGDFWVGVTMHCGIANATQGITILKCGTCEEDAVTPVGSDYKEPEENLLHFAEKADPSTIGANRPALLWDATKQSFTNDPVGVDMDLVPQDDRSYHVTATDHWPYMPWRVKSALTYSMEDFPVFAMVLKDFWGDSGNLYYCAGDITSYRDHYRTSWAVYDESCMMFGEDEEYSLVVVDLAERGLIDDWMLDQDGRIHSVRLDFSVPDMTDPDFTEWDIMYMGWFRSVEEAQQYAMDRLQMAPVTEPAVTPAPETKPDVPKPQDTTAAETQPPKEPIREESEVVVWGSNNTVNASGALFTMVALICAVICMLLKQKD